MTESTSEATEPSYRAPLPEIEDTEITPPTVVGAVPDREEPTLFWGFVSWILIGVGVAVVFAVVLATLNPRIRRIPASPHWSDVEL